jgi:WD40 repeat protein
MVLFSGDSNREIRAWYISPTSSFEVPTDLVAAGNEIKSDAVSDYPVGTVAPLVAHETSLFGLEFSSAGDLWTASADQTAKCLSRERKFQPDTTLEHPDYVRCVGVSEELGVAVTGCRDENVRVWDNGSGECLAVLEGHWEEVTGVVIAGRRSQWAVSVSIDGTVRRWGLGKEELSKAREGKQATKEVVKEKGSGLTEEEERELAELMDESD